MRLFRAGERIAHSAGGLSNCFRFVFFALRRQGRRGCHHVGHHGGRDCGKKALSFGVDAELPIFLPATFGRLVAIPAVELGYITKPRVAHAIYELI